jgi:serine/threonine-protein kinase
MLKGKLGYMSPEQLRFERLDRRSDLFSLGVVLYELLTGSRLYANKDSMGPNRILTEPPPDVGAARAGLPPRLVELTYELLAKDRDDRPITADDVAQRLRAIREEIALLDDESERLASFMGSRFGPAAEEERTSIAEANARLDRGELETWPLKTPVAPPPRRRRWRWLPLAAALATLPIGVGIGAWAFGAGASSESGEDLGSETVVDPSTRENAPESGEPESEPAEEALQSPSVDSVPESAPPEPPRAAIRDTAARSTERRGVRRRRRRPVRMTDDSQPAVMSSGAGNGAMSGAIEPWTFDGMER